MKSICFFFLFLFQSFAFSEKVLIITSAYNRPDFIEIQHKTFEKFLKDEYEFVVFNDAREADLKSSIESMCLKLGIRCINIPQAIHSQPYLYRLPLENFNAPSVRNANVVQYALNNLGFSHDGIVAIIDSDMFLVKEFSIVDFLNGYQIAGVPQGIGYLWIGIAFLDMKNLPEKTSINFNCGKINTIPVDAGGYTYFYLKNHPEVSVRYFAPTHSSNLSCLECLRIDENYPCSHNTALLKKIGMDDYQIYFIQSGLQNVEFFIQGSFFHYRGGSNWDRRTQAFHENKTNLFNSYILKILEK